MTLNGIRRGVGVLFLYHRQPTEGVVEQVAIKYERQTWVSTVAKPLGTPISEFRGSLKIRHQTSFLGVPFTKRTWVGDDDLRGVLLDTENCSPEVKHELLKASDHVFCWKCGEKL